MCGQGSRTSQHLATLGHMFQGVIVDSVTQKLAATDFTFLEVDTVELGVTIPIRTSASSHTKKCIITTFMPLAKVGVCHVLLV